MRISLDEAYKVVRDRAKGKCEGNGCEEIHGRSATSYKGTVALLVTHTTRQWTCDPNKIKLLCFKCSGYLDRKKAFSVKKGKPKKHDNKQVNLMDIL